jgi:hypothetical protein
MSPTLSTPSASDLPCGCWMHGCATYVEDNDRNPHCGVEGETDGE